MTDLEWAIQHTVHKQRGLSKQLAEVVGTSQQVLLNKVNPDNDLNHLNLRDGLAIMKHTGDVTILEVMAEQCGYRLHQCNAEATDLMDSVLSLMSEHGELSSLVQASTADGVIDDKEKRAILTKAREIHHAVEQFESSIESEAK